MTLNQFKLLSNLIISKHKGKKVSVVFNWWHYKDIKCMGNPTFDNFQYEGRSIRTKDFISIARFYGNACIPTVKESEKELKIYTMDAATKFFQIDFQDII